jgi:hypothetical protein
MFDEVRATLSGVAEYEIKYWFAWRSGWSDWKSVSDVEGLLEPLRRDLPEEPPMAPYSDKGGPAGVVSSGEAQANIIFGKTGENSLEMDNVDMTGSQTGTETDSGDAPGGFVVRRYRRYSKRYEVEITDGSNTFRSFSKDVSVGGVQLEESLPEWLTGYFKVRLRKPNQKHQIELTCCLVENQPLGGRTRLSILPFSRPEDEKNLEIWLAA